MLEKEVSAGFLPIEVRPTSLYSDAKGVQHQVPMRGRVAAEQTISSRERREGEAEEYKWSP